jgi:hypothetical protein
VDEWLEENKYTLKNVAIFDFYNVLTHPDIHHRVQNGQIEHSSNGVNTLYFDSDGDDHPNMAGTQKATEEFIPLLNFYYHHWTEDAATLTAIERFQTESATPSEDGGEVCPGSLSLGMIAFIGMAAFSKKKRRSKH